MNINDQARFNQVYQAYLNELTLQGKSPKTLDMYSRCIRQVSFFFDTCPDTLTATELKGYFLSLVETRSWSAVKIARNLDFHPHVHMIVPAGSFNKRSKLWRQKTGHYLFKADNMVRVFRGKCIVAMTQAGYRLPPNNTQKMECA